MIKQVMMSPSKALHHWLVDGMSREQVLSQTGYSRWADLAADHIEALESTEMAMRDRMMSPDDHQREEDIEAVWAEFGDYLKEFVPPYEYDQEIERLLPLIKTTRQMENAARSKPFRNAVRRRKLNVQ
ncbi:hypothetical protein HJA87_30585 [Rhizobium bangladeshense]|uniref:Uncharacterized protein n=1 Tax=Rhizobium bangladeshense TaxID=1138189 RepID=A0ABS7LRV0_9HYPH|nr:hypothetical protein [Rhizobium bangladeshense]MBY3594179.1 hypothetical protein [Rhizobium bangladeshense]